jgi:hypothetical protein
MGRVVVAEKSSIKVDDSTPTLYKQHPSAALSVETDESISRRDWSLKTG